MRVRCSMVQARLLVALFAAALLPSHAFASSRGERVPVEVLIGVRTQSANRARVERLVESVGWVMEELAAIHAYRIRLRPGLSVTAAVRQLSQRSDILYAEPNTVLHLCATPNDTYFPRQQALQKIQADLAWEIWQPKQPVVIAIVDSGIDDKHPDLTNVMYRDGSGAVIGYNALKPGSPALDDFYHGTFGAGVAAAQINNGLGIAGVAGWSPTVRNSEQFVKLMPVKVYGTGEGGQGSDAHAAAGILWAADHGARVINLSLVSGPSTTVNNAVQYAWNHGCVLTAPAGNTGSASKVYPAAFENVLGVAATDARDRLTDFTAYGPWVRVATLTGSYSTYLGSRYAGPRSATSWAAPQVAGEAALIMAQNPSLSNREVSQIIVSQVETVTPLNGPLAPGAGRINVYRALQAAGTGTPTLTALTLSPARVKGGEPLQGTIFLGGPAPAGGRVVTLASSNPAVTSVPQSVTVPEGAASVRFSITTPEMATATEVKITASSGDAARSTTVTLLPLALSFVGLPATDLAGGSSLSGKVVLNGPAPTGGAVVHLASGGPAVTVPSEINVATGTTGASFRVTTLPVAAKTAVGISASYGGVTDTVSVQVYAPIPVRLSFNPASVTGGMSASGQVSLDGPAPEGGLDVELFSTNPTAAVPARVTVPGRARSATFPITTQPVTAATRVGISVSHEGETVTRVLTVTP
jgi:thermitase